VCNKSTTITQGTMMEEKMTEEQKDIVRTGLEYLNYTNDELACKIIKLLQSEPETAQKIIFVLAERANYFQGNGHLFYEWYCEQLEKNKRLKAKNKKWLAKQKLTNKGR